MRGDETPGRIVTNFCTGVGVHDVITCADLYYDGLRGLGVAGNAGLWLRHSRQMPRAYDVEGAYERWLQNMLNRR